MSSIVYSFLSYRSQCMFPDLNACTKQVEDDLFQANQCIKACRVSMIISGLLCVMLSELIDIVNVTHHSIEMKNCHE